MTLAGQGTASGENLRGKMISSSKWSWRSNNRQQRWSCCKAPAGDRRGGCMSPDSVPKGQFQCGRPTLRRRSRLKQRYRQQGALENLPRKWGGHIGPLSTDVANGVAGRGGPCSWGRWKIVQKVPQLRSSGQLGGEEAHQRDVRLSPVVQGAGRKDCGGEGCFVDKAKAWHVNSTVADHLR